MTDKDAVSATELSEEIAKFMSQADRYNGYGTIAENLMSDNWEFICSRLVLSDVLENAPMGLSQRLEIASRMMPRLDENWMPEPAAKRALIFADALLACDAADTTSEPDESKPDGVWLTVDQAQALAAWAIENRRPNGTTAWGPRFDAAMNVAQAVWTELDQEEP